MSRVVSYRDLDLTTSQGAATLETRVRDTARSICRTLHPSSSAAPLESRRAAGMCEQASLDDALPQVAAAVAAKRGSAAR